ncbi:MAG: FAD/NAD(P)-binding oxidoreductase [Microbacteriaceae bacterium]
MTARVLILGAGFGGLELTASLSERFGTGIDITLIDRREHFVFGFSKLDVMFGRHTAPQVSHPYSRINKPGVRFVRTTVRSIDPKNKRVETDAGVFEADYLVLALGADLDPAATPGLVQDGHEFYTNAGAFAVREVLTGFGGGRVIIGVTSAPFKCPPAPSETALLMHEYLTDRGIRTQSEIALVMPMPAPVPPLPAASEALIAAFAERGIEWHPERLISRLDPGTHKVVFADDSTMPYDLFLGVPKHIAPAVVTESGLTVDGWIPVDPLSLRTAHRDVYAIGDVTSVGTPKAGVFAEGQASVVADSIGAQITSDETTRTYDGNGVCYVEFGDHRAGRVDVTFAAGQAPFGHFDTATATISAEKDEYGASRLQRWIGAA